MGPTGQGSYLAQLPSTASILTYLFLGRFPLSLRREGNWKGESESTGSAPLSFRPYSHNFLDSFCFVIGICTIKVSLGYGSKCWTSVAGIGCYVIRTPPTRTTDAQVSRSAAVACGHVSHTSLPADLTQRRPRVRLCLPGQ